MGGSTSAEDDLLRALGARIQSLREGRSLTKADVARLAKVQPSQVQRLELGQEPRFLTLLRIQHALGLDTLDALLGDLPSTEAAQRLIDEA